MQEQPLFPTLNLPPAQLELRRCGEAVEVRDPLRARWVVATPEEWVRQHFVAWLIACKGYPASMMANEVGLRLNGMLRRCDTLIYDRSLHPIAIVEYKAPHIAVTQKVFDQIARYNLVIGARVLIVTNGMSHYCCRFDGNSYAFLRDVPEYGVI